MKKLVKISFLLYLTLFLKPEIYGQAPEIEWQNTIGGDLNDYANVIRRTSDGGYIIGGVSGSGISGDKSEPVFDGGFESYTYDCWIVKLDKFGNIQWENTIGGNNYDEIMDIRQTADGGYIVGATSMSGISGDKTEIHLGGFCCGDLWIFKLNASGNIVWQNTIGASEADNMRTILPTADGGFIVGAESRSHADGDKSEDVIGGDDWFYDYWIIKLDATGNIVWQNTIGSTKQDNLTSLDITADGGYILGGYSSSPAGFDKTEGIVFNGLYVSDLWIIKLNSLGNIEWQNTIGGGDSEYSPIVHQTSDGGYIVGSYSQSGIFGDKTEGQLGGNDIWILKLNSIGNIEWQNTIGGTGDDFLKSIDQQVDGTYIVGAYSASPLGGDKTENAVGGSDFWILKISSAGAIVWQNTIGGNATEYVANIVKGTGGGYVIAGSSTSGVFGDKSEDTNGLLDYWITKVNFCVPEVCNSYDDDCDGTIDEDVSMFIEINSDADLDICNGESAEFYISAFTGYNAYQWNKNGAPISGANAINYIATSKGTYTCSIVSPCGTVVSNGIFLNVNKLPAASISAGGATSFCAGGSVLLTENAIAGCTYLWYKGPFPIAGATSTTYLATASGSYKCRVTKTATGCYKNSNPIIVDATCRENEELNITENSFSIYPNPNSGTFTISASSAPLLTLPESNELILEIFNSLGQCVHIQNLTSQELESNVTIHTVQLPAGVYIVKINNNTIKKMLILN